MATKVNKVYFFINCLDAAYCQLLYITMMALDIQLYYQCKTASAIGRRKDEISTCYHHNTDMHIADMLQASGFISIQCNGMPGGDVGVMLCVCR